MALAYTFALQKCDPSPIYIFDEIDANLDTNTRQRYNNFTNLTFHKVHCHMYVIINKTTGHLLKALQLRKSRQIKESFC